MLDKLFKARSIAVIGASHDPSKLGNVIVRNLVDNKFRGKIFPVNPKGGKLYKKKVFASVPDIPQPVDLAIIVVPVGLVPQVLKECGQNKIRTVIIITAGYGELGADGRRRERELKRIAEKYRIRILGPNCLGVIAPRSRMNASFAEGLPEKGSVTVISQSGAMAVAITDWALSSGLGFSALVSLGNKIDISEEELLSYFAKDPQTKVIVMYLESLATGRSLLRTIRRITREKPVVVLKPGKSLQAQQALASHTGALAGSHKVQNAALISAGAIVATTLQELMMHAVLFEKTYHLHGRKVAILTNAGGPGVLTTDAIAAAPNLDIAEFQPDTVEQLKKFLPEAATFDNPVDVLGDAPLDRYKKTLQVIVKDPGVDAVIALLTHQYVTDTEGIARSIIAIQRANRSVPIVASFIGADGVNRGRNLLTKANVLQYHYPEQAVRALSVLGFYQAGRNHPRTFPEQPPMLTGPTEAVLGRDAEALIKKHIPHVMPSALSRSEQQVVRQARRLGYPVVIKVISRKYIHKTEHGLVQLNMPNEEELLQEMQTWKKELNLRFRKGEGFYLQPYRPGLVDLVVGAKRDPKIGPYLVVGLGGVFVEALKSSEITPLPITRRDAEKLLHIGTLGRIVRSKRGQLIPWKQMVDIMLGVSKLMIAKQAIQELDLNPVMVSPEAIEVADIRIIRTRKKKRRSRKKA